MTAKDLVIYFANQWHKKYGRPYIITFSKEVPMSKRLLTQLSPEAIRAAVDLYLSTYRNDYCTSNHHPFRLLVSSINELQGQLASEERARRTADSTSTDASRISAAREQARLSLIKS